MFCACKSTEELHVYACYVQISNTADSKSNLIMLLLSLVIIIIIINIIIIIIIIIFANTKLEIWEYRAWISDCGNTWQNDKTLTMYSKYLQNYIIAKKIIIVITWKLL